MDINIVESVGLLTRCSFDERYRETIISLGGIQTLAELFMVAQSTITNSLTLLNHIHCSVKQVFIEMLAAICVRKLADLF